MNTGSRGVLASFQRFSLTGAAAIFSTVASPSTTLAKAV